MKGEKVNFTMTMSNDGRLFDEDGNPVHMMISGAPWFKFYRDRMIRKSGASDEDTATVFGVSTDEVKRIKRVQ